MKIRLMVLFTVVVCAVSFDSFAEASDSPLQEKFIDLDKKLHDLLMSEFGGDRPGIVLAITHEDQVKTIQTHGLANFEYDIPWQENTYYTYYSLTKSMVAAAFIELENRGAVSLSHSVVQYLPEFPAVGADITLDDLLRHRSGLYQDESLLTLIGYNNVETNMSLDEMYELVLRQPVLSHEPGTYHTYNDSGLRVAARVLEKATNKSFEEAMKDLVFEPAKMSKTLILGEEPIRVKNKASSYKSFDFSSSLEHKEAYRVVGSNVSSSGDGGAIGTIGDLANYLIYLRTKSTLGLRPIDRLTEPTKVGPNLAYLRSIVRSQYRGVKYFAHGGFLGKRIAYLPEYDLGIAFMTNQNDGRGTREILKSIIDVVIQAGIATPKQASFDAAAISSDMLLGEFIEQVSGAIVLLKSHKGTLAGDIFGRYFDLIKNKDGGFVTSPFSETHAEFKWTIDDGWFMKQADWDDFRQLKQFDSSNHVNSEDATGVFHHKTYNVHYSLVQCDDYARFVIGSGFPFSTRIRMHEVETDVFVSVDKDGEKSSVFGEPFTFRVIRNQNRKAFAALLTLDSIRNFEVNRIADLSGASSHYCK